MINARSIIRFSTPAVGAAICLGLFAYFLYHVTGFHLDRLWPLVPRNDAVIIFDSARQIFALSDYPARLALGNTSALFPYPPAAIVMFQGLAGAGPAGFMATWLLLMAAGLLVTLRNSLAGERPDIRAAWPAIAMFSLLIADASISWDLRNLNSNLIYIGLVIAGYSQMERHPVLAGVLVGVSLSLKLFSGLLLLWLIVYRPRAGFAGILTAILLWIILPVVIFGFEGAVRVYGGWQAQLEIIAAPAFHASLYAQLTTSPPLIPLRRGVMWLTGSAIDSQGVRSLLSVTWAIWLAVLAWYGWRSIRAGIWAAPSRAALADWSVLLLAPLPFNPWLEPYHAVAIVPGILLCLAVAIDDRLRIRDRTLALAAFVAITLLRFSGIAFAMRGFVLFGEFLVLVALLGILRPRLDGTRSSDTIEARAS